MADGVFRFARRTFSLTPGVGVLLGRGARIRMVLAVIFALAVSLLEMGALLVIVPLMLLLQDPQAISRPIELMSRVIGTTDGAKLALAFAVVLLGAYVVKAVANAANQWWWGGFLAREQVRTSSKLLNYYLSAPYALHLQRTTVDMVNTMNISVNQVYRLVFSGALMVLSDSLTVVVILGTLVYLMPIPSLVAFVYFLLAAYLFQRWSKPRALRYGQAQVETAAEMYSSSLEGLSNIKVVIMRGAQGFFVHRFRNAMGWGAEAQRRADFLSQLPKHVMEILFVIGIGVLTGISVLGTSSSKQALAAIALFAAAGFRVLPSIVRIMSSLNNMRAGRFSVDKIIPDVQSAHDLAATSTPTGPPLTFEKELRADGISYTYPGTATEVLQDISLTIPHGSSVAFVGSSGAGKSTLVDILQGLLSPTRGRVCADGQDVSESIQSWRDQIGSVPQEVWLIDGTLRQNVAFGVADDHIDDEAVRSALRRAQLSSWVESLPEGIDTPTGERGSRVSGGQRQRIGIARALYGRPSFLVFDEATSALDNETERRITDALIELHGHTTLLVVAHRLSTVRHCDLVVYLQDGRIDAVGTFDELAERHKVFGRLVQLGQLT